MSVFAAGDGKEREERGGKKIHPTSVPSSVRPPATDWNERFSSLCGVLKGIKEEEEKRGRLIPNNELRNIKSCPNSGSLPVVPPLNEWPIGGNLFSHLEYRQQF